MGKIIIDSSIPSSLVPEQGSINDTIVTDGTTYSSEKIEALNSLKMDKEPNGVIGEILIKDANGNAQNSGKRVDDFSLIGHNHDASTIGISTTNLGAIIPTTVDTIQKLADWIDDNIGFGAQISTGIGLPSNGVGRQGDIYIKSNGDIYIKNTGGTWTNTLINIQGPQGPIGNTGPTGPSSPNIQIQYSTDNSSFHSVFTTGDKYVRFSNDGGSTWSSGMKFIGENGMGSGDMLMSTYDTNLNGIVDNSEKLGGQLPSYYQIAETSKLEYSKNVICRVKTTANITLSGTQTIDGVALSVGDYVLVANQTTASQNGVYVVSSGAWTRATEYSTTLDFDKKDIFILEGTTNLKTWWLSSTKNPTVGTTSITFTQIPNGIGTSADQALRGDFATATATLTNKTLTNPVISAIVNTGTLTLPTSTDTLVGRVTTDTLTNKTFNLANNTTTGTKSQFDNACSDDNFAYTGTANTFTVEQKIQNTSPTSQPYLLVASDHTGIQMESFGTTGGSYGVIRAGDNAIYSGYGRLAIVSEGTNNEIVFSTGGASNNRMSIDSTGAVNIPNILNVNSININNTSGKIINIGNDVDLYDVNIANTFAVYGKQNSSIGQINLGSDGFSYIKGDTNTLYLGGNNLNWGTKSFTSNANDMFINSGGYNQPITLRPNGAGNGVSQLMVYDNGLAFNSVKIADNSGLIVAGTNSKTYVGQFTGGNLTITHNLGILPKMVKMTIAYGGNYLVSQGVYTHADTSQKCVYHNGTSSTAIGQSGWACTFTIGSITANAFTISLSDGDTASRYLIEYIY